MWWKHFCNIRFSFSSIFESEVAIVQNAVFCWNLWKQEFHFYNFNNIREVVLSYRKNIVSYIPRGKSYTGAYWIILTILQNFVCRLYNIMEFCIKGYNNSSFTIWKYTQLMSYCYLQYWLNTIRTLEMCNFILMKYSH